jgi:hypothetical protein
MSSLNNVYYCVAPESELEELHQSNSGRPDHRHDREVDVAKGRREGWQCNDIDTSGCEQRHRRSTDAPFVMHLSMLG